MLPGASVNDRLRPAPKNLKSYCTICCVLPPLRAQHCPVADCCVAQLDHHYLFFGCVGEKNRLRFLLWLITATAASGLVLSNLNAAYNWQLNDANDLGKFLSANGAFVVVSSLWWTTFAFFGFALALQLLLLSINSTLFEATKQRWQIAYLRGYNTCDIPFGRGFCSNAANLLRGDLLVWQMMGHSPSQWSPARALPPGDPDLHRESADFISNPWENKYWSLC